MKSVPNLHVSVLGCTPTRPYFDDPEPGDMTDPAYREEMFKTYKYGNIKPSEIVDPGVRADYEKWLEKPDVEEE
jgi:hypothetical protein